MKLFISVYDRLTYLNESLGSLLKSFSTVRPDIVITDDCSSNPGVYNSLIKFKDEYEGNVTIKNNKVNLGIPYGKLNTINSEICSKDYSEPYFLITDSDMIYKKGWIENLIYLYEQTKSPIITGFNTLTNGHLLLDEYNHFYVKQHVGGCNLLVDTSFYKSHPFMEDKEWDFRMCERAHSQHELGVIASKPSVTDHIGIEGYWARENYHDRAIDFNDTLQTRNNDT